MRSVRPGRLLTLSVAVAFLVPLIGWTLWLNHTSPPLSGDEPHYLVVADSIVHDHDLDLTNNYDSRAGIATVAPDLRHDHAADTRHNHKLRPVQGVGMATLLTPAVVVASNERAEVLWSRRLMVLLGAVLAAALFLLLRTLVPRPAWAPWVGWLAWTVSLPVVGYSNQLYPELPGALCCVFSVRSLVSRTTLRRRDLLTVGLSAAILPWLSIRFLPLALGLVAWAMTTQRSSDGVRTVFRRSMPALAPLVSSCLLLGCWYEYAFGTLSLSTPYRAAGLPSSRNLLDTYQRAFDSVLGPFGGLLIYAPVFLFGAIGAGLLLARNRRLFAASALVVATYLFGVAPFGFRGFALPGRLAVVLTPAFALGIAALVARFRVFLVPVAAALVVTASVSVAGGHRATYDALYGDGAQPVSMLRPVVRFFPSLSPATGALGGRLTAATSREASGTDGSNQVFGPIALRRATYVVDLTVHCDCDHIAVQTRAATNALGKLRSRAALVVPVEDGVATTEIAARHSGEYFEFETDATVETLQLRPRDRPEALDAPVRRSIPATVLWCAGMLSALVVVARRSRTRQTPPTHRSCDAR